MWIRHHQGFFSSFSGSWLVFPVKTDRNMLKDARHHAEFVQPKDGVLLAEYFRNNKSMGIKNIQCFPQCVSEDKLDGEPHAHANICCLE